MFVTNILYRLPNRRLYTWKAPSDEQDNIVKNQIDFILLNERFHDSNKSVKADPGADVSFDQKSLIAKVRLQLKKTSKPNYPRKMNTSRLKVGNMRNFCADYAEI